MAISGIGLASTAAGSVAAAGTPGALGEDDFLQLLVAQLQNQDPSQPADGMQFVTQLAQFSELEQITAMRSDMDQLVSASAGTAAAAGN